MPQYNREYFVLPQKNREYSILINHIIKDGYNIMS
jgi:hypothetical protein